jgi:hypothetical protein
MVKNSDNIKTLEPPKFPADFLACCSCTDGCKTNKCECRWRSYVDNRRNNEKSMGRRQFNKSDTLYGEGS